jgi:tetratricopeptide (TPR) repeat protein
LAHLQQALARAKAGQGQIVGVRGAPGVGKSRLFYEFKLRFAQGCLLLETFSISHGKAYPSLPLIELLKNYFQLTPQEDERTTQEKITGKVLTLDRALEDTLPYLFALLGIGEGMTSLQQMDPQIRRRRTFDAIRRLFVRESHKQPLLVIFEDLHWLDSETEAFLVLLSESLTTAQMCLLVNYRPEYGHSWETKPYYTAVPLHPLGQTEVQELLTTLLGETEALHPIRQFVLDKTQGNPFFTEELVHALVEQGVITRETGDVRLGPTPVAQVRLPPTVQGILAARIDRLPPKEKSLLQTLAVIGKEFAFSLLKQVVPTPEAELQRHLTHLLAADFLYEQPAFPEVEYTFKHALTQEVAYTSLLSERRKALHEHVGHTIEDVYHGRLDEYYSELAHHYSRSSNVEKAIEYLQRTGRQAIQRSANNEAITYLSTALALLIKLPETRERMEHEITLQIALAAPLRATKGYGAPEVEHAYNRARDLSQQTGNTTQLFAVLRGLWGVHMTYGKAAPVLELAERLLQIAQQQHGTALFIEAHWARGCALLSSGRFTEAYAEMERGYEIYCRHLHPPDAFVYTQNPAMACLAYLDWLLWLLGYPEQAQRKSHEALALAQDVGLPLNVAAALGVLLMSCGLRRDTQLAQERVNALLPLCTEQGLSQWAIIGELFHNWLLVEHDDVEEGLARMRQNLTIFRANGTGLGFGLWFFTALSELLGKAGHGTEAMRLINEALDIMTNTGSHILAAELYRTKGELTLQEFQVPSSKFSVPPDPQPLAPSSQAEAEAEACFLKAIEIAQQQHAKSLELRATVSLARLWQQQGTHREAHRMLSEIYNWFTEGFDTVDLKEAKALLEVLA